MTKRRFISIVTAVFLVLSVLLVSTGALFKPSGAVTENPTVGRDLFLFNPYRNVNFNTTQRFKADFHIHTANSDSTATPQLVVERFGGLGFDFLALADHDFNHYGRFRNLPPQTQGIRPLPNNHEFTITYPWEDFGVTNRHGTTPILASELSRLHHMNTFFTDFQEPRNTIAGLTYFPLQDEFEQFAAAVEHSDGEVRFQINHPQRHINEEMGAAGLGPTQENRIEWLLNDDPDANYTGEWYRRLITEFPEILNIEVFNQGDRYYGDRIHYDHILTGLMPHRPVWMSANSDCHGGHSGRSVNVLLMEDGSSESMQEAWQQGAFFAKSFGTTDPTTLPGSRWDFLPQIDDILIDYVSGDIYVQARNYTHFEWITEYGEVISDGPVINFRTHTGIRNFVRGQLTRRDRDGTVLATTLMQPFGVGPLDKTSWFFHYTGFDAQVPVLPCLDCNLLDCICAQLAMEAEVIRINGLIYQLRNYNTAASLGTAITIIETDISTWDNNPENMSLAGIKTDQLIYQKERLYQLGGAELLANMQAERDRINGLITALQGYTTRSSLQAAIMAIDSDIASWNANPEAINLTGINETLLEEERARLEAFGGGGGCRGANSGSMVMILGFGLGGATLLPKAFKKKKGSKKDKE